MENYMHYIYKILFSLFFCLLLIQTELKAQGTIGPNTTDYRRDLLKYGSNSVTSDDYQILTQYLL